MSDVSDTQPNPTQPVKTQPAAKNISSWLSLFVILLLLFVGIFGGYNAGIGQRLQTQRTNLAGQVTEQFQLGLQAMEQGRYEVARQHFEFVLRNAPDYPGIQDAYAELLLKISISLTPSPVPSPTISPTPDLRAAEEIFTNARQLLFSEDWDGAVAALDSLRRVDPTYQVAVVDGMYYMALRNRGLAKIFAPACQDTNLEGGIYDLTLAERFGSLDSYAEGLRSNARLYITAASFWELDWTQAQYLFDQVARATPNLMDASCKTATERYRTATIQRAEELLAAEDFCGAQEQFDLAFAIASNNNQEYYPTATEVYLQCNPPPPPPPQATPTPEGTPTATPTP